MQLSWAPEHSDALRELFAKDMSYSEIARAINARFRTSYSRTATISRASRMGLARRERSDDSPKPPLRVQQPPARERRERALAPPMLAIPLFESMPMPTLRCVDIEPRHLSLMELERHDCRYPYGGEDEGEAITFCGHPQREASSYCTAHFHLTRGPGTISERTAVAFALSLLRAA